MKKSYHLSDLIDCSCYVGKVKLVDIISEMRNVTLTETGLGYHLYINKDLRGEKKKEIKKCEYEMKSSANERTEHTEIKKESFFVRKNTFHS